SLFHLSLSSYSSVALLLLLSLLCFFLMILPPPRSTLFPYTTLFRSLLCWVALDRAVRLAGETRAREQVAAWKRERDAIREVILRDRKSTRLNSSHRTISYAVFCLKKKKKKKKKLTET